MENYIKRCAINRVALRNDLIGDDNSASVENGGFSRRSARSVKRVTALGRDTVRHSRFTRVWRLLRKRVDD